MPHQSLGAAILAGGLGSRLKALVREVPKPLLPVAGQPFLRYVIDLLRQQGVTDIVCCVGYLGHTIVEQLGDGRRWGVSIRYVMEETLLGTGGAVKAALPAIAGEDFVIVNGDTFFSADLHQLVAAHRRYGGDATLALCHRETNDRYGLVEVDATGCIRAFHPRDPHRSAGEINAGIYVVRRAIFSGMTDRKFSIEHDLFPRLATARRLFGLSLAGHFIDIGIPEDYAAAQSLLPAWCGGPLA